MAPSPDSPSPTPTPTPSFLTSSDSARPSAEAKPPAPVPPEHKAVLDERETVTRVPAEKVAKDKAEAAERERQGR